MLAMTVEKHYTVKQLVKILNISERTLWTWVKSKKLRSVKVGSIVRIPASAVKELGFEVKDDDSATNPD